MFKQHRYRASQILKKQRVIWGLSMFVLVGLGYLFLFSDNKKRRQPAIVEKKEAKQIRSAGTEVDPQKVWKFRLEDRIKDLSQKVTESSTAAAEREKKLGEENQQLFKKIQELELGHKQGKGETHQNMSSGEGYPDFGQGGVHQHQGYRGEDSRPQTIGIKKITLSLAGVEKAETPIKTVDNTIPAGTFAQAAVLSGVDASAGLNASSDPRPMLLQIIDYGNLPRRFRSDMKDCRCTASTYGDKSSKRVYARLEKLSCVERATGEIVETQVAGYITGGDGKAGIRGKVIHNDGEYLWRSLMSGTLEGVSSVVSPKNQMDQVNPLYAGNPSLSKPTEGELFKSGVLGGVSSGFGKLGQYYIERAEQEQPTIQVASGQVVDIVFTEGVSIGDTNVKKEISKVRDIARLKAAKKLSQTANLSLRGGQYD